MPYLYPFVKSEIKNTARTKSGGIIKDGESNAVWIIRLMKKKTVSVKMVMALSRINNLSFSLILRASFKFLSFEIIITEINLYDNRISFYDFSNFYCFYVAFMI